MFEEKAKEYAIENYETCLYDNLHYANDSRAREQSFKDGAEFGYNKANEWHYVKDGDLPKEESYYWLKIVLFQTNKGDSYVGFFDYANKAWYEKSTDYVIFDVMAWCEIPKYTEE